MLNVPPSKCVILFLFFPIIKVPRKCKIFCMKTIHIKPLHQVWPILVHTIFEAISFNLFHWFLNSLYFYLNNVQCVCGPYSILLVNSLVSFEVHQIHFTVLQTCICLVTIWKITTWYNLLFDGIFFYKEVLHYTM